VAGSYLFPAKEGIELIKRLPAGSLTLTRKESSVHVLRDKNIVYFGRLIDATFPDLYVAFKEIDQGNYDYFN
jgi:DNA polymerase III subunit beta